MLRGTGSWAELLAQLDAGLEVAPALAQDNLRSPGPPTEPETDHAQQTGGESIGFKFIYSTDHRHDVGWAQTADVRLRLLNVVQGLSSFIACTVTLMR